MSLDRADAADELWGRIIDLADGLADEDRERPTPLPGWRVHDLLGHLSGLQVGFDTGTFLPPPDGWQPPADADPRDQWTAAGVAARRDWAREQVREELAAARTGHVERLRAVTDWSTETDGPVGRTTEAGLFDTRCFDLWVHLQDLHEALDEPIDAADGSAAAIAAYRFTVGLVPWMFGKRAGAPEGARLRLALDEPLVDERVVVVTDGRAAFAEVAAAGDAATDEVTGSPAAFTLNCSGRRSPQAWREAGLLDWSGRHAEAFVERGRMF